MLITDQVLYTPDFHKSFELEADASDIRIGTILLLRDYQDYFQQAISPES